MFCRVTADAVEDTARTTSCPPGVGVEYKSDRIEVVGLFFPGTFKETKLLGIIDLDPEVAENIASQGTDNRSRSFIVGGTVYLVWP